jgi:predicted dehydrogenase
MINVGIIGCGNIAVGSYLPALAALGDRVLVVAVADPVTALAERAAALAGGARIYPGYPELLTHPDLDAVFNLTPAPMHYTVNAAVLDAGVPLYTEKTLAGTLDDARDLIARAQGRLFLCAPAMMVTTRFRWLRDYLRAGRIGTPHLATANITSLGPALWHPDPAVFYGPGVGPLIDTGVYLLHAITGLFGHARRVQAMGGIAQPERTVRLGERGGTRFRVEAPDLMLLQLEFGGDRWAHVVSSYAVPRSKMPVMEIHGTEASISISAAQWYQQNGPVDLYRQDASPVGVSGWMNDVPLPARSSVTDILAAGVEHFIACLEGSEQPILTPEHAIHVLEIMLAATRAMREGRAIELETRFRDS